jgi:hypothetical protein
MILKEHSIQVGDSLKIKVEEMHKSFQSFSLLHILCNGFSTEHKVKTSMGWH